jgi:BirA family transcriptional regulator, biotin operon repressor / biotin---[acetyl-CoA-carboxylase] ligase
MTNFLASLPLLEQHCDELVVLPQVSSTNDYLRETFSDASLVRVVLTDNQTHGRGRLNRIWVTKPGESLAMSVQLPWDHQPHDHMTSWLPLVVGASLCEALASEGFSGVTLKWPNDVVVGEKKLAGILCEAVPAGAVIVGVGLNVMFPEGAPPSPLATALSHHAEVTKGLVDRVVSNFVAALAAFAGMEAKVALDFARASVTGVLGTIGKTVRVVEPEGREWSGVAVSLDERGHLMVTPDGSAIPVVVSASDIRHLNQ